MVRETARLPNGSLPRETCSDCARKHLSQAEILWSESRRGYPKHFDLALGHMAEAEEELVKLYPKEANMIRDERKRLENDPSLKICFQCLRDLIEKNCTVCELEHKKESRGRKLRH